MQKGREWRFAKCIENEFFGGRGVPEGRIGRKRKKVGAVCNGELQTQFEIPECFAQEVSVTGSWE